MIPWRNMRSFLSLLVLLIAATFGLLAFKIGQVTNTALLRFAPETAEQTEMSGRAGLVRQHELVANPVLRINLPPQSVFAPPACGVTIPCVYVDNQRHS